MNRIKDLTKVILQTDQVIMKMIMKPVSNLIVSVNDNDVEKNKELIDYCVVVHKGLAVTNVEVGDIVLEFSRGVEYTYKNERYIKCSSHAIDIATKPDNFELSKNINVN